MKPKRLKPAQRRLLVTLPARMSPQGGLAPKMYAAALRYLFDRPVPERKGEEWYWDDNEPEFDATALEWARIETVLFTRASTDLAAYNNAQVGMGLNYITSQAISGVRAAVAHAPQDEILRAIQAMPAFWRNCIGPRLAAPRAPNDSSTKLLASVCGLWFEHWNRDRWYAPHCRDALWQILLQLLDIPYRAVQEAALYGIYLWRGLEFGQSNEINRRLETFLATIDPNDQELKALADAARGHVITR